MKKLMLAAAVVAAGVAFAEETPGITSANVVGYRNTEVPAGWSFFTPQFKDCVNGKMNLDEIIPCLTNGVALSKDNHVKVQIFSDPGKDAGTYSKPYGWYPGVGWSLNNGASKHTDVVELLPGDAIVVYNEVRIKSDGTEAISGKNYCPVWFKTAGEVIFETQKCVPAGWSFSGNVSYETIDLDQLIPVLTNGVALTKDNHVKIQVFSDPGKDAGTYSKPYGWYPGVGWSLNNGASKHSDSVKFAPGVGYVIYNEVRIKSDGTEAISGKNYCPIFMTVQEAAH